MFLVHGRTPGLDRLGQDRPRVVDDVPPLFERLIHTLVRFVGQLMNARFGSSRIAPQLPLGLTTGLRCQQQRRRRANTPLVTNANPAAPNEHPLLSAIAQSSCSIVPPTFPVNEV